MYIVLAHCKNSRGFTLLIAVIFSSVVLSVATALLDVAYKQVILASTARQSEYAFYNADSALECALYWDSIDTFDYSSGSQTGTLQCEGQSFSYAMSVVGATHWVTFSIPCGDGVTGDNVADVTIVKYAPNSQGASGPYTKIYANGYNTCNASNTRRIQRGEKAQY